MKLNFKEFDQALLDLKIAFDIAKAELDNEETKIECEKKILTDFYN